MITQTNNKLGLAIDSTMRYYALFRYPLQVQEIQRSCQMICSLDEIHEYLAEQVLQGKIYTFNGYFSTLPDVAALIVRRLQGNEKAMKDLKQAHKAGRLISWFPFVEFVGISGSLSKGYSDKDTDFDFFIVTKKDRLWISRTLLHIFKKITFITGQQHKFCMNYFIDETALQLQEKNIYTATELTSLVPVCGSNVYRKLMQANAWTAHFLPNHKQQEPKKISDTNNRMKNFLAGIVNLMNPSGMNSLLMRLTDKKWRRKWARKGFPEEDYNLAFRTTLHISKNHPANYQKRILDELNPKNK